MEDAKMKLKWCDRFQSLYKGVPVEDVVKELSEIDPDSITPEQIVDKARDENSVLHSLFEWDDTVAAEKYRKIQAQQMLTKITFVVDDSPREQRYYHNVSYSSGEYHPVQYVFQHEECYELLKKRAKDYFLAAKAKFEAVQELGPLFKYIDQFFDDLVDIKNGEKERAK